MKRLLNTILIFICLWTISLPVSANDKGLSISPAVLEIDATNELTTTISNNNAHSITIKLTPWLFKLEENRIIPLTFNQVNEYDLSYLIIEPRDFELEANSLKTIEVITKKENFIQGYLSGVLVNASSINEGKINTQINGTIVILNRGNVKGESIVVHSETKPTWTIKPNNTLQIDITNVGEYISKPTGEIQIYNSFNKLEKTIPITPQIHKNLSPTEAINLKTTYHLPIKGLFDKSIEKFKIDVIVAGQDDRYTQTSYVYYINPLLIAVLTLITILILIFTVFKLKKSFLKRT